MVILGPFRTHHAENELTMKIGASEKVNLRLSAQARYQPLMTEDLV